MNELCQLFVMNAHRAVPAAEVLAITAGPNEPRCDLPSAMSQPTDLAAHAGFLLQQVGPPGPAALSCPVSAYGSVPALQLLRELARTGGSAVIHELEVDNNDRVVVYTVTDIRKKGAGVSAAKVLHDSRGQAAGVGTARVMFPREGWFLVAASKVEPKTAAK